MTIETIWVFVPLALILGGLAGWYLRARSGLSGSPEAGAPGESPPPEPVLVARRQAVQDAEKELVQLEARLARLTKAIAALQNQVQESEQERRRLLAALSEHQNWLQKDHPNLHGSQSISETDRREGRDVLEDIDRNIEELELLSQLRDTYRVKINRLTQQVQRQDSELRMLRQAVKEKTAEINSAQALLDQRDAELRRLIRQRQQREVDLENARRLLKEQEDELRRLLHHYHQVISSEEEPRTHINRPVERHSDEKPMLPSGDPEVDESLTGPDSGADEAEDDLTVIPGLADLYARQLKAGGIRTLKQLAQAHPDEVRALLQVPGHYSPDVLNWIKAARRLTAR